MPHTIRIVGDPPLILVTISGDVTRESAVTFNLEAVEIGERHGIHRYLFDARGARNVEPPSGNFAFANEDLNTLRVDRTNRVAMLVDVDDHSHDFVETVARNSGHPVTIFRDLGVALEFLKL